MQDNKRADRRHIPWIMRKLFQGSDETEAQMKPSWYCTEINVINKVAHEKHKCHQCQHNCILVLSVSENPPDKCPKDYSIFLTQGNPK